MWKYKFGFFSGILCLLEERKTKIGVRLESRVITLFPKNFDQNDFLSVIDEIYGYFGKRKLIFAHISKNKLVNYFFKIKNYKVNFRYNANDSDYIYSMHDYRKYFEHKCAKDLCYFERKFSPYMEMIIAENFCKCFEIAAKESRFKKRHFQYDFFRFLSELEKIYEKININGFFIKSGDKYLGFKIFCMFRNQIILLYKQNIHERGADGYFNKKIFESIGGVMPEFVNVCADLGIPGLRKYKRKIKNYKMLNKYEAIISQGGV
jgi:hypothetical protein